MAVPPPVKAATKKGAPVAEPVAVNGRSKPLTAKGKAREEPVEPMEVDEGEVVGEEADDSAHRPARGRKANTTNAKRAREDDARTREQERLQKQLNNVLGSPSPPQTML